MVIPESRSVRESEHLGPFLEGTLWRIRDQEVTDSGNVYQVEAEDPEGIRGL